MGDTTIIFDLSEINDKVVYDTLKEVADAIKERGYNWSNQIVGYLMSGDLGYISSYKEARNKIAKIDREVLLEALLKNYLK